MVSSTRDLSDSANATNTICHVPCALCPRSQQCALPFLLPPFPLLSPDSLSSSPHFFPFSSPFLHQVAISPFSVSACSLRIIRQHLFTFSFLLIVSNFQNGLGSDPLSAKEVSFDSRKLTVCQILSTPNLMRHRRDVKVSGP